MRLALVDAWALLGHDTRVVVQDHTLGTATAGIAAITLERADVVEGVAGPWAHGHALGVLERLRTGTGCRGKKISRI